MSVVLKLVCVRDAFDNLMKAVDHLPRNVHVNTWEQISHAIYFTPFKINFPNMDRI